MDAKLLLGKYYSIIIQGQLQKRNNLLTMKLLQNEIIYLQ